MIVCPNCNKENADNSAHCGFCGHQLQEGAKKTMFGMAALNTGEMQAAAAAAKAAASRAQGSGLNLPKPSSLGSGVDEANAKTEMLDSLSGSGRPAAAAVAEAPDPFADDFAALEQQYGEDPALAADSSEDLAPDERGQTVHGNNADVAPANQTESAPREPAPSARAPVAASSPSAGTAPSQLQQNAAEAGAVERKRPKTVFFVIGGIALFVVLIGCMSGIGAVLYNMGLVP